jgi:hypothetical protein
LWVGVRGQILFQVVTVDGLEVAGDLGAVEPLAEAADEASQDPSTPSARQPLPY